VRRTAATSIAIAAYFAAVLLHEWGHVVLARRHGCRVFSIELYPFIGITRFEQPRTRLAHGAIAWGGVLFQVAAAVPILGWIHLVGYTSFEVVNAFLGMFGFLSVMMVVLNLMPIPPLDGAIAWPAVPLLLRRLRNARR
jgi:Zn-dependent protease